MSKQTKLSRFNDNVLAKYQVYNSVFMTLPFDTVSKTGTLLPLFNQTCIEGFEEGKNTHRNCRWIFRQIQIQLQRRRPHLLLVQIHTVHRKTSGVV